MGIIVLFDNQIFCNRPNVCVTLRGSARAFLAGMDRVYGNSCRGTQDAWSSPMRNEIRTVKSIMIIR